jgi:hypothetical protein
MRSMKNWSVELEAAGGTGSEIVDEDRIDDLVDALRQESVAVSYLPGRYSVRLSVKADDIYEAVEEATRRLSTAVEKSGLPPWPFVQVNALTTEELAHDLAQPTVPRLLGVAELAECLGVTKQRASVLAKDSSFPRPFAVLASGPVWVESTVARYLTTWARRPGRPKSA